MSRAKVGYAAMLEQFHPTELLAMCQAAEAAGFEGVMAADHVQPWVPTGPGRLRLELHDRGHGTHEG